MIKINIFLFYEGENVGLSLARKKKKNTWKYNCFEEYTL